MQGTQAMAVTEVMADYRRILQIKVYSTIKTVKAATAVLPAIRVAHQKATGIRALTVKAAIRLFNLNAY